MGNRNFIPLDKICARSNPENRKVTTPPSWLAKLRECYIQNLKLQIENKRFATTMSTCKIFILILGLKSEADCVFQISILIAVDRPL